MLHLSLHKKPCLCALAFIQSSLGLSPFLALPLNPNSVFKFRHSLLNNPKVLFFFVFLYSYSTNFDHCIAQTETDELPARVGFLGLGIMGSPMAQNLIKAGYDSCILIVQFRLFVMIVYCIVNLKVIVVYIVPLQQIVCKL